MSQKTDILNHLKNCGLITPMSALEHFGCFRLGARISELREDGHPITTHINEGKKKYAIYVYGE